MIREYSIRYAIDIKSNEVVDAEKVFQNKVEGFALRDKNALNQIELHCLECGQKLTISFSIYDRLYLKHLPNQASCILKDETWTQEEANLFNQILFAKESDRHKELKNSIAKKLSKTDGVDVSSIAIDNKFIIRGEEKRKPDVYCKYLDKEIAFEIQLSDLSLRYILSRTEFYRKCGIYLIWILDNFDRDKCSFKRDIKYLTEHENFFSLDESTDDLYLLCKYKSIFFTKADEIHYKWTDESVPLKKIKFDDKNFQIYYYNFGETLILMKNEQKYRIEKLKEEQKLKQEQDKYHRALNLSKQIIDDIRYHKQNMYSFETIIKKVEELDKYEITILNKELNLNQRNRQGKTILNYWLNTASGNDYSFLYFLFNCNLIELDVNRKDDDGKSALQEVMDITNFYIEHLIIGLFKRGYQLTQDDEMFIKRKFQSDASRRIIIYQLAARLENRNNVELIFKFSNIFLTIQSAKLNQIVGFGYRPNEWIAFANNAIEHYKEYWDYIELAFKKYRLWDNLIKLDKKKKFQEKLHHLYEDKPSQNPICDKVIKNLYPELFYKDIV